VDDEQLTEAEFRQWKRSQRRSDYEDLDRSRYQYFLAVMRND
jgi:hypothetical protein